MLLHSAYIFLTLQVQGKQLSTVVLEGYLYAGVSLCSLCGFTIFFGMRAAFGLDACCLFPQCV